MTFRLRVSLANKIWNAIWVQWMTSRVSTWPHCSGLDLAKCKSWHNIFSLIHLSIRLNLFWRRHGFWVSFFGIMRDDEGKDTSPETEQHFMMHALSDCARFKFIFSDIEFFFSQSDSVHWTQWHSGKASKVHLWTVSESRCAKFHISRISTVFQPAEKRFQSSSASFAQISFLRFLHSTTTHSKHTAEREHTARRSRVVGIQSHIPKNSNFHK